MDNTVGINCRSRRWDGQRRAKRGGGNWDNSNEITKIIFKKSPYVLKNKDICVHDQIVLFNLLWLTFDFRIQLWF